MNKQSTKFYNQHKKLIFIITGILFLLIVLVIYKSNDIQKYQQHRHDTSSYNTMERFLDAMSKNENITYQQAFEKHEKILSELLTNTTSITYKTLSKNSILNESNKKLLEATFLVEVAYIYDKDTNIYQILDTYVSEVFITNAIYSSFDSSDYTYEKNKNDTRISVTGRFQFIPNHYIKANEKILRKNFTYYTGVRTWMITVKTTDLF